MRSRWSRSAILLMVAIGVVTILPAIGCGSSGEGGTTPEPTKTTSMTTPAGTIASPTGEAKSVTPSPTESPSPSAEAETLDLESARAVLATFLSAAELHLKGEYSSVYADGTKDGPTPFEIWRKGNRMRIDYYRGGSLYRTLIVSEGKALFYMYGTRNTVPSIMPAEYYENLFGGQDAGKASGRISEDGKSAVFSLDIDAFYKNPNAEKGYYVTKIEYRVDGRSVMDQVVYGRESYGEKPTAVSRVTQTFSVVEIAPGISESTFNPPF